jgi:hypothetical protein
MMLIAGLAIGFWWGNLHQDSRAFTKVESVNLVPVAVSREALPSSDSAAPSAEPATGQAPSNEGKDSEPAGIKPESGSIASETERFLDDLAMPGVAEDREAFANAWIARCLRAQGEGIEELRAWLQSGKDISFETGALVRTDPESEDSGDLRALILASMERWPDADAVAEAAEILRDPNRAQEITDAVRQLDGHEPGQHRVEIKARLRELLDSESIALDLWLEQAAMHQDPSMLAEVQTRVRGNPTGASRLLSTTYSLPPEQAQIALRRLATDPGLLRDVANHAILFSLPSTAYADPGMRAFTLQTLFPAMNADAQERLLSAVGISAAGIAWLPGISPNAIDALLFGSGQSQAEAGTTISGPPMSAGEGDTSLHDRLEFLNLLSPSIHDSKVRAAWQRAREDLRRAISDQGGRAAADFPFIIPGR